MMEAQVRHPSTSSRSGASTSSEYAHSITLRGRQMFFVEGEHQMAPSAQNSPDEANSENEKSQQNLASDGGNPFSDDGQSDQDQDDDNRSDNGSSQEQENSRDDEGTYYIYRKRII